MKKTISWMACAAFTASAAIAGAQTLYSDDKTLTDQGLSVRAWGGGGVAETTELAPADPRTLRISARNFYQGGIVRFAQAPDLAAAFANKDNLLRVTLKLPFEVGTQGSKKGRGANPPAGGAPGTGNGNGRGKGGDAGNGEGGGFQGGFQRGGLPPTGGGQFGGGGLPPTGGQFGGGIPGVPGVPGQNPGNISSKAQPSVPTSVRLIVTTSDGQKSEAYLDLSPQNTATENWFNIAIPLQSINGFERTNKKVLSVAVAFDSPATIFLKKIDITNDTTPIYAEMNTKEDLNLAFGDEFTFIGNGYGGATGLKYEWSFDAEHNPGVDAEGRVVKRRFRKAGDFLVKLTVSDTFGLKKPYSTTIRVTVNP